MLVSEFAPTGIEEKSFSPNDDADVSEVARLEGDSRALRENFPIDDGVEGVVQPSANTVVRAA